MLQTTQTYSNRAIVTLYVLVLAGMDVDLPEY